MTAYKPTVGQHSPWGAIQTVTHYGPDACAVTTAGHGGFWVAPDALAKIPACWRTTPYSPGQWFEEDCDWCIPYLGLGLHRYEPSIERGNEVREAALRTFTEWMKGDPVELEPTTPAPSWQEVDRETAYGHTVRLSRSIRVF